MMPDDETPAAEAAPEAAEVPAEEKPTRLESVDQDNTTNRYGERAPNELKQPKEE